MEKPYFSDRERGAKPRTSEEISQTVWAALYQLIQARMEDGSFGYRFPATCPDGRGPCGTASIAFWQTARAEIPDLPDDEYVLANNVPDTIVILDLLQFCAYAIAKPVQEDYHGFFRHYHLSFERKEGLKDFVANVNRLFARNGIAFELSKEGNVERLGPAVLAEGLREAVFQTGDSYLDELLERARILFLSPHSHDRQDALEKLWDAFERIKTLEPGSDKRAQANALLDLASPDIAPKFRDYLGTEAHQLTEIGNKLRIRHAETDREPIGDAVQIDYLFQRMFGIIRYLLKNTGRGG